jgi:leader peptidase (prepilin peptidase)/N-methyltransferase
LLIAIVAGRAFGAGDVKLAFLLGLFLAHRSWGSLLVGIFLAFLIGGLMSVLLIATRRKGRKDYVPFGPSLVAGAWIGIVWGAPVFSWYLG